MGPVETHGRPGEGPGDGEEQGTSLLARGCLVLILVIVVAVVVVPILVWAAGIIFAGSR